MFLDVFECTFTPKHDKNGAVDASNKSYDSFKVDDGDVPACDILGFIPPTHFIMSKHSFIIHRYVSTPA